MARSKRDPLAEALVVLDDQLRGQRNNFDGLWQDLARYLLPYDATFTEKPAQGSERTRYILDSTGPRSLELFAAFLHNLLNNPSKQWFGIRVPDPRGTGINERPAVRRWREASRNSMLASMEQARIYTALHSAYLYLGAFGTSVIFSHITNGSYRIRSYHLSTCSIREGENELIDTVLRQQNFTPRTAAQRWPDQDLGPAVTRQSKQKSKPKTVTFMHSVFPTTDQELMELVPEPDRGRLKQFFDYASVWINREDRMTVAIGGYDEFPYAVSRWYRTSHEVWGRSPGMTALPEIRMLNRMVDTTLRGAEKLVDPPLKIPDGALVSPVRLMPGGMTFTDGEVNIDTLVPRGASRIDVADGLLRISRETVRDSFFVPLFLTPESPVKTATQVLQETGERNRAASPMLVRQEDELFNPLIRRNYNLLGRAGLLPPAPEEVLERGVEIEYFSPLAGSRQEEDALNILRVFEQIAPWAQIDPGAFDEFNVPRTAQFVADALSAPETIRSTEAEKRGLRAARQQQSQAAQTSETLPPMIDSAANLIKATSPAA